MQYSGDSMNEFQKMNVAWDVIKDTHRENTPSNKTQALTKSMNMDIWKIGTLNKLQLLRSPSLAGW